MNYYIQGDAAKAYQIKAAFEKLGYDTKHYTFDNDNLLFYTINGDYIPFLDGRIMREAILINIIKTHPDYKELELPVEPKFKAEDRIVSKSDKSTIYRIIDLHEERREYIVEIEHKDYHESCPWIAFEDQDNFELVPKKHYDISNFKPFDKVLVRCSNDEEWMIEFYCKYDTLVHTSPHRDYPFMGIGDSYSQCIPFDGNEHLLGTTDMCDEQYINW